jgi:hypothetical protein
VGMECLPTSCV